MWEIKRKIFGKKKYYPWLKRDDNLEAIYKREKDVPKGVRYLGFFVTRGNLVSKMEGVKYSFNDSRGIAKKFKGRFELFE